MSCESKIYLVTPWFGAGSGGAETYARGLACALGEQGRDVQVLTTCSRDPFSNWSEAFYPEGEGELDGLSVRRFAPNRRDADIYARLEIKLQSGAMLSEWEERDWIRHSINSDCMCEFIGHNRESGHFVFLPYLYGTTWHGLPIAGRRGCLAPCLHNEASAYLRIFDRLFQQARAIGFLSEPEMAFAQTRYELDDVRCSVIGGGVNSMTCGDAACFRKAHRIERPYLLYVGRLVPGKGANLLTTFYQLALDAGSQLPDLVMMGKGEAPSNLNEHVHVIHEASDRDVRDAMSGCLALCQPSYYESFSLVLLEAWLEGRPAIVNGLCDVTRHHCEQSNGGLWFSDSNEFLECVNWLMQNPKAADQMGRQGRAYVQRTCTWDATIEALDRLIESPAEH